MNICNECGKETKNKYFCSLSCGNIFRERKNRIIKTAEYLKAPNLCKKCGKPILPKDSERLCDTKKRLCCSSKCYSHPKRNGNSCPVCGIAINQESKFCIEHRLTPILSKNKGNFLTDKDFHSKVRANSRRAYKKSKKEMICFSCGYSVFVEICHIKPINTFLDTAIVSEINHIDNLVALCPNCHWEFDNGLLEIKK